MTALACLKVCVATPPEGMSEDALTTLVNRVGGTYLETRWTWPRRYGLVAPFSFALADPRALRLDAAELQSMAAEIHLMLFGERGDGEVAMFMLEGEQSEVMRFAATPGTSLTSLIEGRDNGAFQGRLCKITPTGAISLRPEGGPVDGSPAPSTGEPATPQPSGTGANAVPVPPRTKIRWAGVYLQPRERFIGSVGVNPSWGGSFDMAPNAAETMMQDMACLRMACAVMPEAYTGVVFVPLDFSGLIKPALRQAYTPAIGTLRADWRPRLAASIYDTPRAPSLNAIRQLQTLLSPFFSLIDLQVSDPAFDIEGLPGRMVTSVSLMLPHQGERERLAAISRFHQGAATYRLKRVLQGVGGVRTARERDLCRDLKLAFVSGPGVAPAAERPWGEIDWPANQLPYT